MSTMKIKKGDTVKVIAGKDKDKEGKVIAVHQRRRKSSGRRCQHADKAHKTKRCESAIGGITFIRKDRLIFPM